MARIPRTLHLDDLNQILPHLVDNGLPDGGEFLLADLADDERTASVIALLVWHGFLSMQGGGMLLPKIHKSRCILAPQDMHIGKKVRRRAKGFHLTVNQAWPVVVTSIQKYTFTRQQGDCWLSDTLADAYQAVGRLPPELRHGVLFHSIELWHSDSGELVAGEIGYTCGSVYSSCTGFAMKDKYSGSGAVQLAALGKWLVRCGFTMWDFGMELDYKRELGGHAVPRSEWARHVRTSRTRATLLRQPEGADADAHRLVREECSSPPLAPSQQVAPPEIDQFLSKAAGFIGRKGKKGVCSVGRSLPMPLPVGRVDI